MKVFRTFFLGLFAVLAVGCSSVPMLHMDAEKDAYDQSVLAPSLTPGTFKKIMVIPPSGTARGQFDNYIAFFEREFLRNGITVISGAVTGRVVLEESAEKRAGGDSGESLSDAERALIMAKKSGADAILQLGKFEWSMPMQTRFFILDNRSGKKEVREVTSREFSDFEGPKHAFVSRVLKFVGRLTNVINGEVVGSFDITSAANFNLPQNYVATEKIEETDLVPEKASFVYERPNWVPEAEERTEKRVAETVARILTPMAARNQNSGGGLAAPVLESKPAEAAPDTTRNLAAQPAAPAMEKGPTAAPETTAAKADEKPAEGSKKDSDEDSEDSK